MSFTDEELQSLKEKVAADLKTDYGMRLFGEDITRLVARLEAAEEVCLETCQLESVTDKLTKLYDAWREAAGR